MNVQVQLQDLSGNWRTISMTTNVSQMVTMEMRNLQRRFPNQRIRAVDSNGRIVDIL